MSSSTKNFRLPTFEELKIKGRPFSDTVVVVVIGVAAVVIGVTVVAIAVIIGVVVIVGNNDQTGDLTR